MQTTANYGLKKPEGNDTVDIDVINGNMDTIDTKLKNNEDSIGNLQGTVNSHLGDATKHIGYAVTTNSGNAYSATIPNLTALTDGLQIRLRFNVAATGAITLNINNLGVKDVYDYYGNKVSDVHEGYIANLAYNSDHGNFILQGKGGGGNATSADLLSGKTATVDGGQITGSIHIYGDGTDAQAITKAVSSGKAYLHPPEGTYFNGGSVYSVENDLITENIKTGKTIFGVSGKSSVVDTADATALTGDKILSGYSAYANGSKVVGTNKFATGSIITDDDLTFIHRASTEIWSTSDNQHAFDIAVDSSGNVYVAYCSSSGKTVQKLNQSGVEVWSLSDIPNAYGIAVDLYGNVYVAYNTNSNKSVRKLNSNGLEIWSRSNSDDSYAYGIAVDSSGNVYVARCIANGKTVQKLNSSGVEVWSLYDGAFARDIALDLYGNVYVAYNYFGNYYRSARKLNPSGVEVWSLWNTSNTSMAYDIAVDLSGNVYVAYCYSSGKTVQKLNSSGVEVWSLSDVFLADGIAVDSSENVYIAYNNSAGHKVVRKLNSNGVEVWALSDVSDAADIAVDSDENVYVAYDNEIDNKNIQKLYGKSTYKIIS